MSAPPCLHPRRWFYRQTLVFIDHHPVYPVVERCQQCHAITRESVPMFEIKDVLGSVAAVDIDRWEGADVR